MVLIKQMLMLMYLKHRLYFSLYPKFIHLYIGNNRHQSSFTHKIFVIFEKHIYELQNLQICTTIFSEVGTLLPKNVYYII